MVAMRPPWLDPRGRFSPLKALALAALCVPVLWTGTQWAMAALGARPLDAALHLAGLWAIRLLLVTLAITPLAALLRWPRLILLRRMAGVATFAYAALHLTLYAADKNWHLGIVASEIVLRVYLGIGFMALLTLAALAATSTDGALRRLGARAWTRLHLLTYPASMLALIHHFLQAKRELDEPLVVAGLLLWLLCFRLLARRWGSPGRIPLPVTAAALLVVGPLVALGEAAYWALARGIDPVLPLSANLTGEAGIRPAWVVGATTLALLGGALARYRRPRGA